MGKFQRRVSKIPQQNKMMWSRKLTKNLLLSLNAVFAVRQRIYNVVEIVKLHDIVPRGVSVNIGHIIQCNVERSES